MALDLKRKKKKTEIVLASASPRRRDLLKPFYKLLIRPADIDESRKRSEMPKQYVLRVAYEKWQTAKSQLCFQKPIIIVSSDTSVVLGDQIFGKPKNEIDAKRILNLLSNREHQVMSAICVGWNHLKPRHKLVITKVRFRKLTDEEIHSYIVSKEWQGKAGGYAIQGKALSYASNLVGSLTGVIGLPLKETLELIEHFRSHPPA